MILVLTGCHINPRPQNNPNDPGAGTTGPYVLISTPADGEEEVSVSTDITVHFSDNLNEASVTSDTFSVRDGSGTVSGNLEVSSWEEYTYETDRITFEPAVDLSYGTEYTVTLTTGICDFDGNGMDADYSFSFTTCDVRRIETNDGEAYEPRIEMDGSGNAFVVWHQLYDTNNCDIWSNAYTTGSGWGTAERIEADTGDARYPEISVNDGGEAMAVWHQSDGTRYNIWANRYTGTGWSTAVEVDSDDTGDAEYPHVDMNDSGDAVAVWQQSDGSIYSIWANQYTSGSGWQGAEVIDSEATYNALAPRVAVDSSGNAIAVWKQYDGSVYSIWSNRYVAGSGWLSAAALELDDAGSAEKLQIDIDDNDNVHVVWRQSDGSVYNIWTRLYTNGSGWGSVEVLETGSDTCDDPYIDVSGNGHAAATWWSDHDVSVNRYTPAGGWVTAESLAYDSSYGDNLTAPSIAVNDSENAAAVWRHYESYSSDEIRSKRFSASAGEWDSSSSILDITDGEVESTRVDIDGSGNVIAVWEQDNDIWAHRF